MEEIKSQICKLIEKEYKEAMEKGILDSYSIVNKIWKLLAEKKEDGIVKPEPVYGCYENSDEYELK